MTLHQRIDDIEVEWFRCTRLFGAVQHDDGFHSLGQSLDKMFNRERTIQSNTYRTDLLALSSQILCSGFGCFTAGTHEHHNSFCFGMPRIIEEVIGSFGNLGELIHSRLHNGRRRFIVRTDRLASLEIDIGILGRAAYHGMVGGQSTRSVLADQFIVNERAEFFI